MIKFNCQFNLHFLNEAFLILCKVFIYLVLLIYDNLTNKDNK